MDPITLYASDTNRKAAFMKAGIWMFFSVLAFAFTPFGIFLGAPLFAIGFWFGGPELGARGARRPSFKADADGFTVGQKFTVTDRHRMPWDEFRGVTLGTEGVGPFFQQRTLVVKTASRGDQKIKQSMMSGTPEDMAQQINDYGRKAQLAKGMSVALAEVDQTQRQAVAHQPTGHGPAAAPTPAVDLPLPSRQPRVIDKKATDTGPIKSTPRLGERMFGRRKVI